MKKTLVKVAYWVGVFSVVIYWWQRNQNFSLHALSHLFGLMAGYLILMQLLLIGRIKWIERQFGHDKLTRIHHTSGYFAFTFLILHFVAIIAESNLFMLLQIPDYRNAFFALMLIIFIIFLSVTIVRKNLKYETWYYIHIFMYLAIALAFGHQIKTPFWYAVYIFVFANLFYFRFFLPIWRTVRYKFKIEKIVRETKDAVSIYITGTNLHHLQVIPGQFVIVRFLQQGFMWEAHPFSISDYPNGKYLRLTIKNSGDFTAQLEKLKVGTYVELDGPHGRFTTEDAKSDKFLLIAGGVGITPIRSILQELLIKRKDVVVLYSSKTENGVILKNELDALNKKYKFKLIYPTEHITGDMIKNSVPDYQARDIYICGPVAMMDTLATELGTLGVKKEQVHMEKFSFV